MSERTKYTPDEWVSLLPRINEMRRKGLGSTAIAQSIGVPKNTLCSALNKMRSRGHVVIDSVFNAIPKRGELQTPKIDYGAVLPKLRELRSYGLSGPEISAAVGIKYDTLKTAMPKIFSEKENEAWAAAKEKRRLKARKAPKVSAQAQKASIIPNHFHPAFAATTKEAGHPISWGALWGGNPPAFPKHNGGLLGGRV